MTMPKLPKSTMRASLIFTVGLVVVFGWFGIEKILHPMLWIGWMPMSFEGMFGLSRNQWLTVIGVTEIVFAVLILVPIRNVRKTGALLMAAHLFGVISIAGFSDIGIRDFGLLTGTIALFFLIP